MAAFREDAGYSDCLNGSFEHEHRPVSESLELLRDPPGTVKQPALLEMPDNILEKLARLDVSGVESKKAIIAKIKNKNIVKEENLEKVHECIREYFEESVPELDVIRNILSDFHLRNIVESKPRYQGLQKDGPAVDFLSKYYENEINNGILTAGDVKEVDIKLYRGLRNEIYKSKKTTSLSRFFITKKEKKEKRAANVAILFGIPAISDNIVRIVNFFRSIRADASL